ncbi:PREDICTED: TIP41-like protein isoform X2 [Amphimedon queenslandica]|uniref:TIP41-like protein n=1 Tax=Amphimedon queenslandica TaxID=400682 RepID=A0A1X7VAY9_AMPQE|nr:PREDICTED: TIP41-like protein isoform X2 [Amphimedon queenslandica]|eukprot:XP_011402613.1 PREDICTED: TIP41-like protein isoform X2 [Amphimedon queenslandica]
MESFDVGPWKISVIKSHILKSKCEGGSPNSDESCGKCNVCRYSSELELPWLPEMVFPNNRLIMEHVGGPGFEFNPLDALKMVDAHHESVQVAAAKEWRATRSEGLEKVKDKVKSFDWTFTTEYNGSYNDKIQVSETDVGIDYERLKVQERIHFFDDIVLFEDELADNGTAELRVKIRVMASGFFILLRFFLRVDDVIVRLNDTRIYHAAGTDHMIREFSKREVKLPNPQLSLSVLKDINKLSEVLPHTNVTKHKLVLLGVE